MKVMIVVTHLLGTGHLARALTLARAFTAAGHASTVVSGGFPAGHLDGTGAAMVQLPPLRSDGVNFTRLLDAQGATASADYMQRRSNVLKETVQTIQPDVIITELFPFGRRVLRDEFMDMLSDAQRLPVRPLVCASIRDILAPPSKPAKAVATKDIVRANYDAVLVHSDARIMPLETSWPVTSTLQPFLHYTGFVTAEKAPKHPQNAGAGEILVSAGGGDVGANLFDAALAAAAAEPGWKWRILVGGQEAPERVIRLRSRAPANVIVEPARPDFRQMLHHVDASVSLCGYNTALDILQMGPPAVFIPFDAGGEVEQTLRAKALALLPGIEVVPGAELTKHRLLQHLHLAMSDQKRSTENTGFDGAPHCVEIVENLRERQRGD